MFIFDAASLKLLEVNAAAIEAFGSTQKTLLAMTIMDLLDDASFHPGAGAPMSVVHPRADGARVELEVTTHLLRGRAPLMGLGVVSNVTRHSASENRLRIANEQLVLSGLREHSARDDAERANAVKDEFLAVMSHELRTPLQAMMGWIALLRSGTLNAEDAAHGLDVIERNTRIQAKLVADLLDVSRAASGKLQLNPRPLDLRRLVAAAIESFRVAGGPKDVRLESLGDGPAVVVFADPMRLEQVITNLLVNAIKFTPAGGAVQVNVNADEDRARLRITDSGEGFDPAFMPVMFESFTQEDSKATRTHGGLGLGLMIVRHLVEAHGGSVRAESRGKGHGATFIVELPLSDRVAAPPGDAPAETPAKLGAQDGILAGVRVLVVEDHADSRELVSIVLQRSGAEVRDAGSASEALRMLAAAGADIVVSDLGMPEVDGYDFLRSLRQAGGPAGDVPVIALSAYAGAEDRERALAAGFHAHAAKPIDPRELVNIVARAAGRNAA